MFFFTICKPVVTYVTNSNRNIFNVQLPANVTVIVTLCSFRTNVISFIVKTTAIILHLLFPTTHSLLHAHHHSIYTRVHPTILNVLTYTHARTVYLKYHFYYTDANILRRKNRCLSVTITRR